MIDLARAWLRFFRDAPRHLRPMVVETYVAIKEELRWRLWRD